MHTFREFGLWGSYQLVDPSTRQPVDPSNRQPINPSTHHCIVQPLRSVTDSVRLAAASSSRGLSLRACSTFTTTIIHHPPLTSITLVHPVPAPTSTPTSTPALNFT